MSHKINIYTPFELMKKVSQKAKILRLQHNLKRSTLAKKSNVTEASLKRFELTGKISFESLLKIASALNCLEDFLCLFPEIETKSIKDIEKLEKIKMKKRGRL
ncbi:MAG: helix-turn-helix transcriptional regulator [Pseudomonadota bacterium]